MPKSSGKFLDACTINPIVLIEIGHLERKWLLVREDHLAVTTKIEAGQGYLASAEPLSLVRLRQNLAFLPLESS